MIGIRGRDERHGRLVVGRPTADTDCDPTVREGDNRQLTFKHCLAAEHLGIEAPGALNVPGDDEVGERESDGRRWELCHLADSFLLRRSSDQREFTAVGRGSWAIDLPGRANVFPITMPLKRSGLFAITDRPIGPPQS